MNDDWRDQAECKGVDPNIFFPGRGDWMAIRIAKTICAECEVRAECLEEAILNNEQVGVFGGTTPYDRRKIRRTRTDLPAIRRFRQRPSWGTENGYKWHLRHKDAPCLACRQANSLRRTMQQREAQARREQTA